MILFSSGLRLVALTFFRALGGLAFAGDAVAADLARERVAGMVQALAVLLLKRADTHGYFSERYNGTTGIKAQA
jgi:hypothetical protein